MGVRHAARWRVAGSAAILVALAAAPAAGDPKRPHRELVFPVGQLPSAHGSSLVELTNGDLFLVWYSELPNGDSMIWGATRPAGGDRWGAPRLVHDTPELPDRNPVLYRDGTRTLRLFWTTKEPWLWRDRDVLLTKVSQDAGETWGEVSAVELPPDTLPRASPLRLANGWVLLPLYVEWSASSVVAISTDGGATWGRPHLIMPFLGTQPAVIQRADGTLYALMRSGAWPRRAWQAVSRDRGARWHGQSLSSVRNPGAALAMLTLENGEVALAFNDSTVDRSNLTLALSEDEGATWAYTRVVEDEPGRAFDYPSLLQDREGLIHVVYSYRERRTIAHVVTDAAWIRGEDEAIHKGTGH